jgi:guanylate kinase
LAVSYTTRKKRPQEKEGVDYFYISKERFEQLQKKGFFLEWEKVVDDYYGTPKCYLDEAKKQNKSLVLCIDVKGALNLKRRFKALPISTIFINAPSYDHLHKRMQQRADACDLMHKRIKLAKKELQYIKKYDYLIVNQNIDKSLKILEAVLIAESIRRV